MKQHDQMDRLIAQQSSEWLATLDHADSRERRDFARWVLGSARHVRGFLLMKALDEELRHIDPERRFRTERLKETKSTAIATLENAQARRRRNLRRRWPYVAGIAAGLAALMLGGYFATQSSPWRNDFSTAVGEQRTLALDDGSLVHLNTQSEVEVRFTDRSRDIRLLRGEALFQVHRDPARPFRVHTADVRIQALGTEFNVYRRPQGTTVAVLEGRVEVSPDTSADARAVGAAGILGAGEAATIEPSGKMDRRDTSELEQPTAWRQRRLVFKQTPLAEVVVEFNRYNRAPRFRVEDSRLAGRRYSGVFDADDPQSLMELLAREGDVALDRDGEEIVVRSR